MPNLTVIRDGVVENVIVADYTDIPPEGTYFGPIDQNARIGWLFDGNKYIDPNEPALKTIITIPSGVVNNNVAISNTQNITSNTEVITSVATPVNQPPTIL